MGKHNLKWDLILYLMATHFVVGFMGMMFVRVEYRTRLISVENTNHNLEGENEILRLEIDRLVKKLSDLESVIDVEVTAYNPVLEQCDSTPELNAIMEKVKPGTVAVSRDLWERGWTFGKKIYLRGLGVFRVADLMNPRHNNHVDVFMWDRKKALQFGVVNTKACLVLED